MDGFFLCLKRGDDVLVCCDNSKCKYNDDKLCMADNIGIINRNCKSSRKKPKEDNYKAMMQEPFKANCHKENGGYKANHVKVIK